jgi:D-psicose/D-tagatose/L-ribulose 3-epimerase
MVSKDFGGTGVGAAGMLKETGYDYVELSLAHIMNLSDAEFEDLRGQLAKAGIGCEVCHNFFPASIRLTGPNVDMEKITDYVEKAFGRANRLGAEIVVFGSSGAKNVPDGFPMNNAWQQLVEMLRKIDPFARRFNITIAVEPINTSESNIINSVREGLVLVRQVNRKNIQLLVDYYHLTIANESIGAIDDAKDYIKHIHFAQVEGRQFPKAIVNSYTEFFGKLKSIGYNGRISIEAFSNNLKEDAATAIRILTGLTE